jgi:predicted N-acetyltransferase YhbS
MIVELRRITYEPRYGDRADASVLVRRAELGERKELRSFVEREFGDRWARATDDAMKNDPPTAFIAVDSGEVIGFAFYDAAFRGYLGPMGVREDRRGRDVGGRLLIAVLKDMGRAGYAYAVIGDVGPIEFYEKVAGAVAIPR